MRTEFLKIKLMVSFLIIIKWNLTMFWAVKVAKTSAVHVDFFRSNAYEIDFI